MTSTKSLLYGATYRHLSANILQNSSAECTILKGRISYGSHLNVAQSVSMISNPPWVMNPQLKKFHLNKEEGGNSTESYGINADLGFDL